MNRNEFTQALLEFARRIAQAKTQREKKRIIAERDLFIRMKGNTK